MRKINIKNTENAESSDFMKSFKGKLFGVLRWKQLDDLWDIVKHDKVEGWYLYAIGEPIPTEKTKGERLNMFIDEINGLLRREHKEDYCGVVYTDNLNSPRLIKVFDPNNLGTSCSIATEAPLPSWVICKMKPEELSKNTVQTASRRRWWQGIFN